MKQKAVLMTVEFYGADVLLVPNGRGSWAAMSYAQYRRAGLRPMKVNEKRKIRIEIHDVEVRT